MGKGRGADPDLAEAAACLEAAEKWLESARKPGQQSWKGYKLGLVLELLARARALLIRAEGRGPQAGTAELWEKQRRLKAERRELA